MTFSSTVLLQRKYFSPALLALFLLPPSFLPIYQTQCTKQWCWEGKQEQSLLLKKPLEATHVYFDLSRVTRFPQDVQCQDSKHSSDRTQVCLKITEKGTHKSLFLRLHHFEDCLSLSDGYKYEHHQCDPEWSQEHHRNLLLELLMPRVCCIHSLHYGGCHSSKEHSQAPSQRSFASHLHRDQALAQLSKEHFLTQGPQRSLKRFLADLWGRTSQLEALMAPSSRTAHFCTGLLDRTLRETRAEHTSRVT